MTLSLSGVVGRLGSSPRRRGTLHAHRPTALRLRIIPAQAGNTFRGALERLLHTKRIIPAQAGNTSLTPAARCLPTGSSPRRRGTLYSHRPQRPCLGSSPRRRGTPRAGMPNEQLCRIIPAQAGNTSRSEFMFFAESGSSPRRRGTRDVRRCEYEGVLDRIIPAQAGNT